MKKLPNPRKIVESKEEEMGIKSMSFTFYDQSLDGWYEYKKKHYRYVGTLFGMDYYAEDIYSDDFGGEEVEKK